MNNKQGLLGRYNLWDFWNSFSDTQKQSVITYYESSAAFWDYKTLFVGENYGTDIRRGAINVLNFLLVSDDLKFCDKVFNEFLKYNPENYLEKSWGHKWQEEIDRGIEGHKMLQESRTGNELQELNERWDYYYSLKPDEVYWFDTHFFIINYAARVYKNYLKSNCSIDRFYKAFEIEYTNYNIIIQSVNKLLNDNGGFGNKLVEQYLIYLEKAKRYEECVSMASVLKSQGWQNDFNKRIDRCNRKLEKYGNKS